MGRVDPTRERFSSPFGCWWRSQLTHSITSDSNQICQTRAFGEKVVGALLAKLLSCSSGPPRGGSPLSRAPRVTNLLFCECMQGVLLATVHGAGKIS